MENNKGMIAATKEETEKYFVSQHGPVAKVFLAWKDSLGEAKSPNLRALDMMMDIYKRNDKNVGLIPHMAPDVDLSNYQILFKELDKFKIQKMRDNSLGNTENSNAPKLK